MVETADNYCMSNQITKERLEDLYLTKRMSQSAIARELGATQGIVQYHMAKFKIPARQPAEALLQDLTGRTFHDWTVTAESKLVKGVRHWLCRCSCGSEQWVRGSSLYTGRSKQCKACWKTKNKYARKYKGMCGGMWGTILSNACRRGIEMKITQEYAWELFQRQQGRCALSGIELKLGHQRAATASLDRIDNEKGYLPGNVQWVYKDINMMRRVLPVDRFVELCKLVATHNQ